MINLKWYIKPATKEDFITLYGEAPKNTLKAWTLICNDKICGIGGVALVQFKYTAFCKKAKDVRLPNSVWYKAILQGFNEVKKMNVNILAIRDEKQESAERLLKRLGFEIMEVRGKQEIHICLNQ